MLPLQRLDQITTAEEKVLALYRRGQDWCITIDDEELMSSRVHGSEQQLAALACEPISGRSRQRVLVGGLGMGFTLRAVLDALGPRAEVVVAEVFAAVVRWNQQWLGALAGHPLDDPRVRLAVRDVYELLDGVEPGDGAELGGAELAAQGGYDAIVLDVDNGPDALVVDTNYRLYGSDGLRCLHRALAPHGVLAVWSAARDPGFLRKLHFAGFVAREVQVRAHRTGKGARHTVFVAAPAAPAKGVLPR